MRILIVEDEPIIALNVQTQLVDAGYRPIVATSVAEALTVIDERPFDVALLDITLPDGDSFELAREMRKRGKPFVFTTGSYIIGQPEFSNVPVVNKPYDEAELSMAVQYLTRQIASHAN